MSMIGWQELSRFGLFRHTFNWQSNANGDAELQLDGQQHPRLRGLLDRSVTRPDSEAAPTLNYDVTLEDWRGYDLLEGEGTDRSATATEPAWPESAISTIRIGDLATIGPLRLRVANAGNTKAGQIELYLICPDAAEAIENQSREGGRQVRNRSGTPTSTSSCSSCGS